MRNREVKSLAQGHTAGKFWIKLKQPPWQVATSHVPTPHLAPHTEMCVGYKVPHPRQVRTPLFSADRAIVPHEVKASYSLLPSCEPGQARDTKG